MNRPNILQIICHDLGRHLGCYGIETVHTPALDRLASVGVRFTSNFCTSPGCSPSRAAIATGRYPHQNGVMGLAHAHFGWELGPEERATLGLSNAQKSAGGLWASLAASRGKTLPIRTTQTGWVPSDNQGATMLLFSRVCENRDTLAREDQEKQRLKRENPTWSDEEVEKNLNKKEVEYFVLTRVSPDDSLRVGDGGMTFLARQPGGRNEADRAEPEHAEQRRPALDSLPRGLTAEAEELAFLVGAAPGPDAVGGSPRQSHLVVPLAVEHDLRARRRPLAQPAHELGMAREIPFAMPVGDHQEGGNDAALGAEGPQPLDRRRERRGHVVNRDQQAHRRRTRRYTSKSRSKTPSQPWCAAA